MRAHNQWLRMACKGVEEVYLACFRKVSWEFWGAYDAKMRDWCCHSYTRGGGDKCALFSQTVSLSIQKHLATHAVRWTATSDHWLTNAWSQKECHLGANADAVRLFLLNRKRAHSPEGMHGERARVLLRKGGFMRGATRWFSCAATLPHRDAI